jgi:hypothetical protein
VNGFGIGRRHRPLNNPRKPPKRVLIWVSIMLRKKTKMSMNPILKNPSPMFLANWKWFRSTHPVPIGLLGMMLLTFWEWMILFPFLSERLRSLLPSHRPKGSGTPEDVLHVSQAWKHQVFDIMLHARDQWRARQQWKSVIQSQVMRSWRNRRRVWQWTPNMAGLRVPSAALSGEIKTASVCATAGRCRPRIHGNRFR